ncbi:hypothetical protein [Rathayibacter tanaceti]|uniref:hypothetical protein n=1 Tax=Rathayibacter tanaceti TaxID=1671680 RepID=UPI001F1676BC|nr:hypothetical protein [Rathayibacter tanaceti]
MADVHFGARALQTLLGDWREQRGTRPAYLALATGSACSASTAASPRAAASPPSASSRPVWA